MRWSASSPARHRDEARLRIDSYAWRGGREAMPRFGPDTGPVAVVVMPLFEEANRMRAFAVTICRVLAGRGVASVLPDVPGQGESLVPLEQCSILDISEGVEYAGKADWEAGRSVYAATLRSGALLDKLGLFHGRWHFAPQDGTEVLRDLKRIKQASLDLRRPLGDLWYLDDKIADTSRAPDQAGDCPVEIAGNSISAALLSDLSLYSPWKREGGFQLRTVRLDTDPRAADRHVPGTALWRRAEPDNDLALATTLAGDIADWIAACEG